MGSLTAIQSVCREILFDYFQHIVTMIHTFVRLQNMQIYMGSQGIFSDEKFVDTTVSELDEKSRALPNQSITNGEQKVDNFTSVFDI